MQGYVKKADGSGRQERKAHAESFQVEFGWQASSQGQGGECGRQYVLAIGDERHVILGPGELCAPQPHPWPSSPLSAPT